MGGGEAFTLTTQAGRRREQSRQNWEQKAPHGWINLEFPKEIVGATGSEIAWKLRGVGANKLFSFQLPCLDTSAEMEASKDPS